MTYRHQQQHANGLEDIVSDQLTKVFLGDSDPNSADSQQRAEFYSNVMAKTAEKYMATEQGQAVLDQALTRTTWYAFMPGVLLGLAAGWLIFTRRAPR